MVGDLMAYRRRRSGTKGRKCIRRKRVRVRGQGMALRCVKYGPKRGGRKTKRRKSKRRGSRRRPFNKGKKCIQRYANGKCRSYGARPRVGRAKVHGPMTATGTFWS